MIKWTRFSIIIRCHLRKWLQSSLMYHCMETGLFTFYEKFLKLLRRPLKIVEIYINVLLGSRSPPKLMNFQRFSQRPMTRLLPLYNANFTRIHDQKFCLWYTKSAMKILDWPPLPNFNCDLSRGALTFYTLTDVYKFRRYFQRAMNLEYIVRGNLIWFQGANIIIPIWHEIHFLTHQWCIHLPFHCEWDVLCNWETRSRAIFRFISEPRGFSPLSIFH